MYLLFRESNETDTEDVNDAAEDGCDDDVSFQIIDQTKNLEADPRSDCQDRDCSHKPNVGFSKPEQNVEQHFSKILFIYFATEMVGSDSLLFEKVQQIFFKNASIVISLSRLTFEFNCCCCSIVFSFIFSSSLTCWSLLCKCKKTTKKVFSSWDATPTLKSADLLWTSHFNVRASLTKLPYNSRLSFSVCLSFFQVFYFISVFLSFYLLILLFVYCLSFLLSFFLYFFLSFFLSFIFLILFLSSFSSYFLDYFLDFLSVCL